MCGRPDGILFSNPVRRKQSFFWKENEKWSFVQWINLHLLVNARGLLRNIANEQYNTITFYKTKLSIL